MNSDSRTEDRGRGGLAACAECGAPSAPDQAFCESCGAVLRWSPSAGGRGGSGASGGGSGTGQPDASGAAPGAASGRTPAAPAAASAPAPAPGVPAGSSAPYSGPAAGTPAGPPAADLPDDEPTLRNATAGDGGGSAQGGHQGPGLPAGTPPPPGAPPGAPGQPAPYQYGTQQQPGGGAPAAPDAPPAPPAGTADTAAPRQEPGATDQRGASWLPPEGEAEARARALLVPVAEPGREPAPDAVAPVLPGRPEAQRPQVQQDGPMAAETGPPCPWCGTANRPDRHFCRRCAMSLSDRPDGGRTGRLPWWRRIFSGRREAPWAGERPRLRRGLGWLLPLIGWGVLAALIVYAVVMTPTAVQAVKDHFAKRAPIEPDSYSASRSFPGHAPKLAFDKISNTYWGPGVTGEGAGEWIEARFDAPVNHLDVLITPGTSKRADKSGESARPQRLEIEITKADGKKEKREITLDYAAQGDSTQRRKLRVRDVRTIRITILSSYGEADDKQVAIAEIEFFGPSTAGSS